MTVLNHTVEQMITATSYSRFEGLERLSFRVVVPDWRPARRDGQQSITVTLHASIRTLAVQHRTH